MNPSSNILKFTEPQLKKSEKFIPQQPHAYFEQTAPLPDLKNLPSRLKPQHLIGLLFAHGSRTRRANMPKVTIKMSVFTPTGEPAIQLNI